jgi:hypothetical protein
MLILLKNNDVMFIYGLYSLLDDSLMTSTFDDIYEMMMLLYFL